MRQYGFLDGALLGTECSPLWQVHAPLLSWPREISGTCKGRTLATGRRSRPQHVVTNEVPLRGRGLGPNQKTDRYLALSLLSDYPAGQLRVGVVYPAGGQAPDHRRL